MKRIETEDAVGQMLCHDILVELISMVCYNTENYVFCSAIQVIYRIVLVYSVSKMF